MSEENLLEQGSKDLLQDNTTPEQLKTEVTSIVEEEERTGQKIEIPSADELVARASSSMIINRKHLGDIISKRNGTKFNLNRKAMTRVMMSILDLPTGNLPVHLKTEEEKLAFALGQRMISDRFIIMQHHISEEMKKRAKKLQESAVESKDSPEDVSNPEGGSNE